VRGYADITGDHNKIHVDDAFAKTTIFDSALPMAESSLG